MLPFLNIVYHRDIAGSGNLPGKKTVWYKKTRLPTIKARMSATGITDLIL
jgi:hypothetical protein